MVADPEMMTSAAADLATIGANVSAAQLLAAAPTLAVVPAAADEVSAAIASVFANHAQAFQGLAGKAAAFNDQFVGTLKNGGAAYAQTEVTSAAGLSSLLSLLPTGIQSDLLAALANLLLGFGALGVLLILGILGIYIGAVVLGILLTGLMHPHQLLQLLMMWGL